MVLPLEASAEAVVGRMAGIKQDAFRHRMVPLEREN